MPQQTDHARPTKIESLDGNLAGHKVRLAGRMLSYEPITGLALLLGGDQCVIVDVSLCVNSFSGSWARERLCLTMVVGYVETCPTDLAVPTLPSHAQAPMIDPRLVVRAVLVTQCDDVDLDLWNTAIDEGR